MTAQNIHTHGDLGACLFGENVALFRLRNGQRFYYWIGTHDEAKRIHDGLGRYLETAKPIRQEQEAK